MSEIVKQFREMRDQAQFIQEVPAGKAKVFILHMQNGDVYRFVFTRGNATCTKVSCDGRGYSRVTS